MMTEQLILTLLVNIIQKHGCSIRDIDLEKNIIDIDGDIDNLVECAAEMDELLGKYLV